MNPKPSVLENLDRAFSGGIECAIARGLLSFLISHPEANHITLQLVRQLSQKRSIEFDDAAAFRTLQYLAGGAAQVLEHKFELVDIDENGQDVVYALTDDEVHEAAENSTNPISGVFDPQIKTKVALFFSPTEGMTKLLSDFDLFQKAEDNG